MRSKVLVIDDDPIVLEVVRERLEAAGYHVLTRQQALGTTQVVRDEKPDIVLLDIMMPALSGGRIAHLLKTSRLNESVGVVLYSSKSDTELSGMLVETGAIGAISKTVSEEEFMRRLDGLVQRQRGRVP